MYKQLKSTYSKNKLAFVLLFLIYSFSLFFTTYNNFNNIYNVNSKEKKDPHPHPNPIPPPINTMS